MKCLCEVAMTTAVRLRDSTKAHSRTFCAIAVELSLLTECLGARLHDLLTARRCGSGAHGVDVGQVINYGENLTIEVFSLLILWSSLQSMRRQY